MLRFLIAYVLLITCNNFVHGAPKVPCHFIFGDSLFDAGNNNALSTKAKANYPPYGVDFPGGIATGRFTNGLTTADVLTKLLGFQGFIPPFVNRSQIQKGVNYASGGAGILSKSGSHLGDRIWLARQVQNHGITIKELQSVVEGPVGDYLNKCLYSVNIGSNDYINNYFMPEYYSTKKDSTPDQFAKTLVAEYEQQLKQLYLSGARKTAIFGVSLIGCIPAELRRNKATFCVDEINEAVHLFNQELLRVIENLNKELDGAKFTFIDIAAMQSLTPLSTGFITDFPCCELRSDYQCEPNVRPCHFRSLYSFIDGFHPTETINIITAKLSNYSPVFVHPVNIRNLIRS